MAQISRARSEFSSMTVSSITPARTPPPVCSKTSFPSFLRRAKTAVRRRPPSLDETALVPPSADLATLFPGDERERRVDGDVTATGRVDRSDFAEVAQRCARDPDA